LWHVIRPLLLYRETLAAKVHYISSYRRYILYLQSASLQHHPTAHTSPSSHTSCLRVPPRTKLSLGFKSPSFLIPLHLPAALPPQQLASTGTSPLRPRRAIPPPSISTSAPTPTPDANNNSLASAAQPPPILITTATPPIVPSFAPVGVPPLPILPGPSPSNLAPSPTANAKKSSAPKPPCQACNRVLDSNRCMSSGLRERVINLLPDGVTFKVKGTTCSIPPAKYLPEPRSDASFLCQSCIKWLNKHTLPAIPKLVQTMPTPVNGSGANALPVSSAVALVPQVLPSTNAAITAVPTSQPTNNNTISRIVNDTGTIHVSPSQTAGSPNAQEERRCLQEERHKLQEERAKFLDERRRFQDEKDRLNDSLNATRLELKNKRDECERLQGHASVLCDELISRLRGFASACDGGTRKRARSS